MRSLACLAVVLCSCGGPDFTGLWRGKVVLAFTCSDGSSRSNESGIEWSIAQTGRELSITPDGGTCGAITADVTGNAAELRAKACPGGGGFIESGTATLEGAGGLRVSTKEGFPLGSTSCSGVETGTLARAP